MATRSEAAKAAKLLQEKKHRRAHFLHDERLSLVLALLIFKEMTSLRMVLEGANALQRARIGRHRARQKIKMIARLREIEQDPDYGSVHK